MTVLAEPDRADRIWATVLAEPDEAEPDEAEPDLGDHVGRTGRADRIWVTGQARLRPAGMTEGLQGRRTKSAAAEPSRRPTAAEPSRFVRHGDQRSRQIHHSEDLGAA